MSSLNEIGFFNKWQNRFYGPSDHTQDLYDCQNAIRHYYHQIKITSDPNQRAVTRKRLHKYLEMETDLINKIDNATKPPEVKTKPVVRQRPVQQQLPPPPKYAPILQQPIGTVLIETTGNEQDTTTLISKLIAAFSGKTEVPKVEEKVAFELDMNRTYNVLETVNRDMTLMDLIELGKGYSEDKRGMYAFNYEVLNEIVPYLEELNGMVGMKHLKKTVVKKIVYDLLDLGTATEMNHIMIQGPPGVGKTSVAILMAKIYNAIKSSINKSSRDVKVAKKQITVYSRQSLIGGYLGQTAIKTQKAIEECLDGVMIIDEVYSLLNKDKDSYADECIITLLEAMTKYAGRLTVIMLGYKEDNEKLIEANKGMARRITHVYNIEKYTPQELTEIFVKMANDAKWKLGKDLYNTDVRMEERQLYNFMRRKYDDFPNFGGDIETLFSKVKYAHGMNIFGKSVENRMVIGERDFLEGYETYLAESCRKEKRQALNYIM